SWINWSELANKELVEELKLQELLKEFKKIVSESKLTEEGAKELADRVNEGMVKDLKKKGLL
ncbi:MAG: hypothetical protein AABX45_02850, partial [Nanoarchaeota archaeon]